MLRVNIVKVNFGVSLVVAVIVMQASVLMAKAAEQFADLVIVTQDNPRTEDPK